MGYQLTRLDPQDLPDQQVLQMLGAVRVAAEQDQLGAGGEHKHDADDAVNSVPKSG